MPDSSSYQHRLIRMPDVANMTGLARSTIYAKIQAGEFPKPLKISHRHVAWVEQDVIDWIENLPHAQGLTWQPAYGVNTQ